ncbi:hypothetical protein [Sinomonas sp. ASV322]|uniref:hypothetical protein n=1 Tax=Sinomonas sp. ASV322 TaxID=3041920 RepID=UPI0027DE64E4|nr:hypothetical protein [Sinomonas sp. ASV322]MDQ4504276.1 hypothetical protein [Sinomonas sp. ASV322]
MAAQTNGLTKIGPRAALSAAFQLGRFIGQTPVEKLGVVAAFAPTLIPTTAAGLLVKADRVVLLRGTDRQLPATALLSTVLIYAIFSIPIFVGIAFDPSGVTGGGAIGYGIVLLLLFVYLSILLYAKRVIRRRHPEVPQAITRSLSRRVQKKHGVRRVLFIDTVAFPDDVRDDELRDAFSLALPPSEPGWGVASLAGTEQEVRVLEGLGFERDKPGSSLMCRAA